MDSLQHMLVAIELFFFLLLPQQVSDFLNRSHQTSAIRNSDVIVSRMQNLQELRMKEPMWVE
eukprot:4079291-Amphidinium_carterae.1